MDKPIQELDYYLRIWQLSNPRLFKMTATSHLYLVQYQGEETVLKLLSPLGIADEGRGAHALSHFNGKGAVCLLKADEHAHLLEYASGEDLLVWSVNGRDDEATAVIANVLNHLHDKPLPSNTSDFVPLMIWFRALFNRAKQDSQQGNQSIFVRASTIARRLLTQPQDIKVLHGDIHHQNIRYHPQRGWLAFDPKGLMGERTFDFANLLCNPLDNFTLVANPERLLRQVGILADHTQVDAKRILVFVYVYACLSACWLYEDHMDATQTLAVAHIAEQHLNRDD